MVGDAFQQAIEWRIRVTHGDADDWRAFTEWLEADPAHSAAYDEVALADLDLDAAHLPDPAVHSNDNDDAVVPAGGRPGTRVARWLMAPGAIAAMLVLTFAILPLSHSAPEHYAVATLAGQKARVDIGGGTYAELNGATRLVLDRADDRFAELASGEATFFVKHDPSRPFRVAAGDGHIQDVGTVFNLIHDPSRLSLEVIEGKVLFNPERQSVPLSAGQTLTLDRRRGSIDVGRKAPRSMAGWRHNLLSYSETAVEAVASDLGRNLGIPIEVDDRVARQRFTGSIRLADGAGSLADFAATVNLVAKPTEKGWRIEPDERAPH